MSAKGTVNPANRYLLLSNEMLMTIKKKNSKTLEGFCIQITPHYESLFQGTEIRCPRQCIMSMA